jgi:hypothetical protein
MASQASWRQIFWHGPSTDSEGGRRPTGYRVADTGRAILVAVLNLQHFEDSIAMSSETDAREISRFKKRMKFAVRSDSRLPEPVFQPAYGNFHFVEFDVTIGNLFWPVLQQLMRSSEDTHMALQVLDPHPVRYFFAYLKNYGYLRFEIGNTSDDYYAALAAAADDSPADALIYSSEVIVWIPDSGEWVIWGERSLGIAVIAALEPVGASLSSLLNRTRLTDSSAELAVLAYVAPNFRNMDALDTFSRKFKAIYGKSIQPL